MATPVRIQRRRTKGWRMPPNTVSVCRPGKWGNPHPVAWCPICGVDHTQEEAVAEYRSDIITRGPGAICEIRAALAGKNLACFCPLDKPCHADVLLQIANQ